MNIGFYFLSYKKENKEHWSKLIDDISSETNNVHIITNQENKIIYRENIIHHTMDISYLALSRYLPIKLNKKNLREDTIKSIKYIRGMKRYYRDKPNTYLNNYMIFWNNIIDNNNIQVIYLMEPLNVPYDQEIIILEDICNSKGIHFKFLRSTFIHYNVEVHNSLRRVKINRLKRCYDEKYWEKINNQKVSEKAEYFKKRALEFMDTRDFIYSISKGKKIINDVLYNNDSINFQFPYILLLLTKINNVREFYVSKYFFDKISMIKHLSQSLPLGYKLVVKDHPQNIGSNAHIRKIENLVNKLNNVLYVNNNVETLDLVSKSDLVISTTSHSAYQSLFQNKKVALFGHNLFIFGKEPAPVFRINNYNKLRFQIENILQRKAPVKYIDRLMFLLNESTNETQMFNKSYEECIPIYCKILYNDYRRSLK